METASSWSDYGSEESCEITPIFACNVSLVSHMFHTAPSVFIRIILYTFVRSPTQSSQEELSVVFPPFFWTERQWIPARHGNILSHHGGKRNYECLESDSPDFYF